MVGILWTCSLKRAALPNWPNIRTLEHVVALTQRTSPRKQINIVNDLMNSKLFVVVSTRVHLVLLLLCDMVFRTKWMICALTVVRKTEIHVH